ncbi:3-phosphoglycerate dehydrogenase family protein [Fundicoccus sp. Sow4_H7]|uniref:3-phosphoglycerate dehydrogenase family protein n=1 Tax=Fundicoccus sp. Sow4_H7 TaxID=3438784 RepID=UPI003F92C5A3
MDIRVYNKIADEGLDILMQKGFSLNQTNNPEGIILRSENINQLPFNQNLLAIARAGAGINNIPVEKAIEKGIVVFNTPGANANAVSELVFTSLIVAIRNMLPAMSWLNGLMGEDISSQVEAGKKQFKGSEIKDKTIGVIGLGSIGHMVANTAIKLGMEVYGYDPYIKEEAAYRLDSQIKRVDNINTLYEKADFVTIHVPYTKENHHFINKAAINSMKKTAILLNFSRSELVDLDAVIEALDNQILQYYLTDFPEASIMGRSDCLLFPHLGASTNEAEKVSAQMAAHQLSDFILTGNIRNSVNFPNVQIDIETDYRLAIVNRNIPNMITLLVTELGDHQINIAHLTNKSRGAYAYTLIDFDEENPEIVEAMKEKIFANENILSARLIQRK